MDERSYTDFDLVIEQSGDKYRASVINSPAGQASVEFDSLFAPLELENFVLRMGRPQRGMRRIDSTEMSAIKTFGTRLFRTVFSEDVYACYLRSIDSVRYQNKGLRIRLRINVPQFHDLPWEYLYNPQFDQFLALSKDTPIIRYIELPYTTQALPVKTPMKILVMISSPEGFPPLDVEEEWKRLNRALQPLIDRDLVVLERLEHATLSALQQQLRRSQTHIFHFIGHGKYFEQQQDGMLLLEDENGRGRPTSGQHLGAILHDHHTLRLVVLNACEGARTSAEDPYTGVAQTLVRQGIPAVLAMQFEIFEHAAITLAQEFYGAIADGYPVDAALSEARKAIFANNNDVEWGTPVLFMRIPNGILFRPETATEKAARVKAERLAAEKAAREKAKREAEEKKTQEQRALRLEHLYTQVKNQIAQQDWSAAIDFIVQIQGIEPDFRDVTALREQAEAGQERADKVAELLTHGEELIDKGNWPGAVQIFRQILELAPGHVEAQVLLSNAEAEIKREQEQREREAAEQRQAQLTKLYEQANAKMAERDWGGASRLFEEIDRTEPGYQEVKNLLKQAQTEKERQEKFVSLVAQGKKYLEKDEWMNAVEVFQQALALDAKNAEAQVLLSNAEAQVKREHELREREAEAQRQAQLTSLYEQATAKMAEQDWVGASKQFEEIEQIEPGFRDVKNLLKHAQTEKERREKLVSLVAQGKKHLENHKWMNAAEVFQQALVFDAENAEAQALLSNAKAQIKHEQELQKREAEAQRQAQLAKLYEQASAKMAERDWANASKLFEEIERSEPGFRDVKNLLEQAQTGKERQEKFVDLVAQGKEYLEKKREWLKAIGVFQQALEFDFGNVEAQALLAEAERGKQVKDLFDTAQEHFLAERWSEAIAKFQAVLELEPTHVEANRQLANAMIKLARQEEDQKKKMAESEEPISRLMKPVSYPEQIKPSRPSSIPEKIQTSKPGSLPEEIKPGKKPRDLPK